MKKDMSLEGLRWSCDSGSALYDTPPNGRSRTGWGGTEKGDFLYEIFAVFSLLKILAIISNKIEKYKAFKLLDETSYGVYIFHMIFLYVFYCIFKNVIGEQYMIDNEVVLTSILAIFTVPFSIIATLLLQQTKILKL